MRVPNVVATSLAALALIGCRDPSNNYEDSGQDLSGYEELMGQFTDEELACFNDVGLPDDLALEYDNNIFGCDNAELYDRGVMPEDAGEIWNLIDIMNNNGDHLFNVEGAVDFQDKGIPSEFVASLARIDDSTGSPYVPTLHDYARIHEAGVPTDLFIYLSGLTDQEGDSYWSIDDIIEYHQAGGIGVSAQQVAGLKTLDGKKAVGTTWMFDKFLSGTLDYDVLEADLQRKNQYGIQLFDEAWHAGVYRVNDGTDEQLEALLELKDHKGRYIFTKGRDLAFFTWTKGKVEDIEAIVEAARTGEIHDLTPHQIWRYAQLEIPPDEIGRLKVTGKPQAVLILPEYDWNGGFENWYAKDFVDKVRAEYDTLVLIATYDTICTQIPSWIDERLVIFAGHGYKYGLRLGGSESLTDEMYYLDVTDTECRNYLASLPDETNVFNWSCETANGTLQDQSFTNQVAIWADGNLVTGSTQPFSAYGINVKSMVPFNVQLNGSMPNDLWGKYDTTAHRIAEAGVVVMGTPPIQEPLIYTVAYEPQHITLE